MKNINKLQETIKKIIICLGCLIFISSCANSNNTDCVTCDTKSKRQVNFIVGEKESVYNLWDERDDTDGVNINYSLMIPKDGRVASKEISSILKYYNLVDVIDEQKNNGYEIMSIILFTKQNTSENKKLLVNGINGLLVYFKNNNSILSKVYNIQDSNLLNIKELNSTPKRITSNAYYYCSKIFGGYHQKVAALVYINSDIVYPTNRKGDDFELILKKYIEKINTNISSKEKEAIKCSFPCSSTPSSYCGELGGNFSCNIVCRIPAAKGIIENSGNTFLINVNDLYDFRDNFLNQKSKGQTYLQYYDEISYQLVDNLTLSISLDGMNIAISHVIPAIDKLMNYPNSNTVLYDSNAKNDIVNFLNNIKTISNDINFINTIDQIILDVNNNVNKTVNEVVTFFN